MRARAVIGANFGDEGKGLFTDFLAFNQGADMVVRFNGGAQAGHTVVTPGGDRHVFSHFGSATFCGVPTFLSQFFICNPILFLNEARLLVSLNIKPVIYAHPNCLVTTFADMIINQRMEDARGAKRHGSVGVGFNETLNRSKIDKLKITMADIWNNVSLESRLVEICDNYARFRLGKPIEKPEALIAEFIRRCAFFADLIHPLGIAQCGEAIYEGAQGLLLSQDNAEFYPHLTHSYTGARNVRILCNQAGIAEKNTELFYITRSYVTRHGAGPLPDEDAALRFEDTTNNEHAYQGKLRFASLDVDGLLRRCRTDAGGDFTLVMTHCDQRPAPCKAGYYVSGPAREAVLSSTSPLRKIA